jgi:opacity protein-like surface antigen
VSLTAAVAAAVAVAVAVAAAAAAAAVKDEDDVQWWRRGGRSMAAEAFDGDGGGGYG